MNMEKIINEEYKVVFTVPQDVRDIIEKRIGWKNIDGYLIALIRNEFRNDEYGKNNKQF